MREILFRAYDTGRKEYLSNGNLFIAINASKHPNKSELYLDIISDADRYKDRFVIEQYTGLTDKNGKKIFDGDIVKTKNGRLCEVYWFKSPNMCGWDLKPIECDSPAPDKCDLFSSQNLEVVGNIHDNPELLKGGEQE